MESRILRSANRSAARSVLGMAAAVFLLPARGMSSPPGKAPVESAAQTALASIAEQFVQSFELNSYKRVLDGQWEGIRYASDGNVYFGSSTHSAHHGASFFKYDSLSNQITLLAEDITTICGEDPQTNPQGKLHSDIVEANGWLYMSTHFSSELTGAYDQWSGSHVIGYELATGEFRDYGVVHPNYTSYSGVGVDPARNYLYVFVTGQSANQVSYLYRIDTATGVKTNLGQVGGSFNVSQWMFVDRRGDVWFSIKYQNGDLRRVRADTGQIDVFPNALPPLYRWDSEQVVPSAGEQASRSIRWMQPLDGDRAVFTLGSYGGMLYQFDASKPIGSGQEFQNIKHIGHTDLGMAVGGNRVFYYQRANRGFGNQDARDFHLLSVSLDPGSGYPITDRGLLKDQDGRVVWRAPGMMTDGQSRVFMIGDWWTIPGDLGTLRYNYNGGAEVYVQLPRGEFFAVANVDISASATDTTAADFGAGTTSANTAVSQIADGEVILAATLNEEFSETTLPSEWSSIPWTGGTATVSGGLLTADGTLAANTNLYAPNRSIEFVATFGAATFQQVGFGQDLQQGSESWAMFSTKDTTGTIFVSTNNAGTLNDTAIPGSLVGSPHRYRIDWGASSFFFVDGVLVHSENTAIGANMRPVVSDFTNGGPVVTVDWLRMSPYAASGSFTSRVFDGGQTVDWGTFIWTKTLPTGTSLALLVRTGNTSTPDGTWTAFASISSGSAVAGSARYLQYRADLATSDAGQTPVLRSVTIDYPAAPSTSPPAAVDDSSSTPEDTALSASVPGVLGNDTDTDPLTAVLVSNPTHAASLSLNPDGSFSYMPAANFNGSDSFTYKANDGAADSNVATVTITVNAANDPPVVTNPGTQGSAEGASINLPISASDPDGDTLTYSATGLPGGLSINPNTGVISGTISAGASSGSPYSVPVTATDSSNATGSANFSWTVNLSGPGPVPPPWLAQDIGAVGLAGSASHSGGAFTVNGAGADIWDKADKFHYAYLPLAGDGEIVARVFSIQNTNSWAKAGVMIRETLATGSANAMMAVTRGRGLTFQRRLTAGGTSAWTSGGTGTAPYWVRLVRSGSTFTGFRSLNGVTWTQVGSATVGMASNVFIGLAVTSHDATRLCAAVLDNVSLMLGTVNSFPTVHITSPGSGASFNAPATIAINATAADSDGSVTQVQFYSGATFLGTDATNPYSHSWVNVGAGSYSLTARATDNQGATTTSAPVSIAVNTSGGALPAPWVSQDVGAVGAAGSASFSGGAFTAYGSGADIYGTSDQFRYVYRSLSGNGQIVARVTSLQNTNAWAKTGVMIRESLAANSANAMMLISSTSGMAFQRRVTTGGASVTTKTPGATPYWLKLTRSGNTFTAYRAADGITWTLVGSASIPMASDVLIGLAVTSHANPVLCMSVFDNVMAP